MMQIPSVARRDTTTVCLGQSHCTLNTNAEKITRNTGGKVNPSALRRNIFFGDINPGVTVIDIARVQSACMLGDSEE